MCIGFSQQGGPGRDICYVYPGVAMCAEGEPAPFVFLQPKAKLLGPLLPRGGSNSPLVRHFLPRQEISISVQTTFGHRQGLGKR